MALVLFESRVNMITVATPSSVGGVVIGYDETLGVLTQKDYFGVITPIGSGSGMGSLAQTLSIGRRTGTNSIFLDVNTRVESNIGSASLRLDNGTSDNYLQLSSSNFLTGSTLTMNDTTIQLTGLSSSVVMNTSSINLNFGTNQFLLQNNNSYLKLGTTNVLEFTTATSSRAIGSRVPVFISSDGSRFSNTVNNSVIIGGSNIVGTQSNSVYVPNLIIKDGGYVKGISGDGQLRFNSNESYLTSGTNIIGILEANGVVMSNYNGIFITDNTDTITTTPTSANAMILSSNTTVDNNLTNTVVIGGQNLTVDSSDTVYLGGTVDINNQYTLPDTDGSSGQFIKTDGVGNLSWSSGAGSVIPVITITAAAFSVLSSFSLSSTYRIINADVNLYGGTEIYLTTNSEGILNDIGEGKFYNPRYDQTSPGYKIWGGTSSSYTTGFVVYWGGRAWRNNNGTNTLASVNKFALNLTQWTAEPVTNGLYYSISYDKIKYDRITDKIIYRDERGTNIVSTNTQNILYWEDLIGYSPIKVFQWGNIYDFDTAIGIGSQNIINSYNDNINFRGIAQNNITMNNLSGQYNLNTDTSSVQDNLVFDNYLYDRQSILLPSEYNLVFQGDLPQQNPTTLVGKLNNQQVEIDLLATTLVTPTIVSRWDIYKSGGTTSFGPVSIGVGQFIITVGTFSTSNSVTVPNGCIVNYTGRSTIPAATTGFSTPTTRTGSFTFAPGDLTFPLVSATLSTTGLSVTTPYTTTLTKPKTGLIVSGSQVIVATGSDTISATTSVTFNDLFYFGYLDVGLPNITITQGYVDGITASQIEGLGNYRFGGKAQTFVSNDDGAGSRLVFAYRESYGLLSTLVVQGESTLQTNAFTKRTDNLVITTLSGLNMSYIVYVANADNTWGNGGPVTLVTT